MEDGALGLGTSLIYAPAFYASTEELVALARVAGEHGGRYISHIRSEANRLEEAVDELIHIAREAQIPAEIYHLKAAGRSNWDKLDSVIEKVEAAREEGLDISADMYTYTAGSTGLDAAMPPWVQEGGYESWVERLRDPATRKRVVREMTTPTDDWENLYLAAGADKTLLVGFKNEELKPLTGKTLAEVAEERGKSAEETAIDLVIEDGSRVQVVYFLMSEENVARQVGLPWVAFGSDAGSMAPEGVFLESSTHPRAYGNFARLLGKYVREEGAATLADAIRRLTSFPAENLKLRDRGRLAPGHFADVVVFDPQTIGDHATYESPHTYATGVVHVFVNGEQVLRDGEHTGAKPGRVVQRPGLEAELTPRTVDNSEVARLLDQVADLLEIKGDTNPFRIRSYRIAAEAAEAHGEPVGEMDEAALKDRLGVGSGMAARIREIVGNRGLRGSTEAARGGAGRTPGASEDLGARPKRGSEGLARTWRVLGGRPARDNRRRPLRVGARHGQEEGRANSPRDRAAEGEELGGLAARVRQGRESEDGSSSKRGDGAVDAAEPWKTAETADGFPLLLGRGGRRG